MKKNIGTRHDRQEEQTECHDLPGFGGATERDANVPLLRMYPKGLMRMYYRTEW